MRTAEQTGAAPHADGTAAAIIAGSTPPRRKADTVAHWVRDIAVRRKDAACEVADLRSNASVREVPGVQSNGDRQREGL
jgi:hypothetical protein